MKIFVDGQLGSSLAATGSIVQEFTLPVKTQKKNQKKIKTFEFFFFKKKNRWYLVLVVHHLIITILMLD